MLPGPFPRLAERAGEQSPGALVLDGDGGLGYFTAFEGTRRIIDKALDSGIAIMMSRNHALQTMRQQESNRLQAGVPSIAVRETLEAHIAFLDEQINQLTQRIRDHIDHHPDLKQQKDLLTSIPGIADVTATKLLAEIPSLERFQGASQLAAYAGLTPRQHQSGSSVFRRFLDPGSSPG